MIYVTLASGWVDLVIISIAMVIAVGNAMSKAIKRSKTEDELEIISEGEQTAQDLRRETLAQKHREHLEQLLGDKQVSRATTTPQTSSSQTLYERRAQAAHASQIAQVAPAARSQQPQQDISRVRQREIAQQREHALAQKRTDAKRRQRNQALGAGLKQVDTQPTKRHAQVHRHVVDAPDHTATHQQIPKVAGIKLTSRAMKQALILKEILDPPVAMRENHLGI